MTFNLRIELEYDFVEQPLDITIQLNDNNLFSGMLDTNMFEFICDSHPACTLKIYMHNKPIIGTLVDDCGNIVKDTFIKIKQVEIDRRYLKAAVIDCGKTVYYTGEVHLKNNYISQNGYYELAFTMPINQFLQNYYDSFDSYKLQGLDEELAEVNNLLNKMDSKNNF
jgi:hypothetical protein